MIYVKYYASSVGSNTKKTLKNKISLSKVLKSVSTNDIPQISNLATLYDELNFWDLGKAASNKISKEDILIIICKDDIFCSEIVDIIYDKKGVLGDYFGWSRQFKNPWQNVIALKNLKMKLKVRNNNLVSYAKKYGLLVAQNFYEIPLNAEGEFEKLLKSYFLYIETDNISNEETVSDPIQQIKTPDWITDIRNEISVLRQDVDHQERGHESLVEKFFEGIGYERVKEIKYRLGHVDILIQVNSKPYVVTEVKKSWKLSYKDTKVVHQAYRYALENGARYVVITNGDYFAVFDRMRGFTLENNFIGEYFISKSNNDVLQLIKLLSRKNLEESNNIKNILTTIMQYL